MKNKTFKKCSLCFKTLRKKQKVLKCDFCAEAIHFKCDNVNMAENNISLEPWKCNYCTFTFPYHSCSNEEFWKLFNSRVENIHYNTEELNDLFKDLSTFNDSTSL